MPHELAMAKPKLGLGGKPALGAGGEPLVCETDDDCCEGVTTEPVSCAQCPELGDSPGAFQATLPGLELWEHVPGDPDNELQLLQTIAGGVFLCHRFFIYNGAYCCWFGPEVEVCTNDVGDEPSYWLPCVIVGPVGADKGGGDFDDLTAMWQDFSQTQKDAIDLLPEGSELFGIWDPHLLSSPLVSWDSPVDFVNCAEIDESGFTDGSDITPYGSWFYNVTADAGICNLDGTQTVKLKQLSGATSVNAL